MRTYIEEPEKYKDCGYNARHYFKEHFTLEHYMNELEHELQVLCDKRH